MSKNWSILGIADDEGVKNVGGRIGAAQGPQSFSTFYNKLKPHFPVNDSLENEIDFDLGTGSLSEKHEAAIEKISSISQSKDFSVIVGGGHDYIYCHLAGVSRAFPDKTIGCINIDPHFDMREPKPKFTSGSPFFVALSEGVIDGKNLIEFGIQEHCNAPELWDFAKSHGVKTVTFPELREKSVKEEFSKVLNELASRCDHLVVSFDLDSVASPFAPGVSAPAVEGFTPTEAHQMMELSGSHDKVKSLGIYELNPRFDRDDVTARLAATSCHYFAQSKLEKN
ncbi:formimidoylglutamase [Halocola ammonii]